MSHTRVYACETLVPVSVDEAGEGRATAPRRPFRFGVIAAWARSGREWQDKARRVESLGYATLVMPDNLQRTLATIPALAMAAAVTRTLRLGTYVLPNDFRNPVLLAKDLGTLDMLSDGRLEIGLGAGRADSAAENAMLGVPFGTGGERVARLSEAVGLLKDVFKGDAVTHSGHFYSATEAAVSPLPVQKPRPPLLIAGSGRQLLTLAAREADIVAFGFSPDANESVAAERIGWVRDAAGPRFGDIELNTNLMAVGDQVPRWIAITMGVTARDLAERGSIAAVSGDVEQMCDQLRGRRERLGISYLLVSDDLMDAFAPVVERLAGA